MLDGRLEGGDEVVGVAQGSDHAHPGRKPEVPLLNALDDDRDAAALESLDELDDDARARGVEVANLREPHDHDAHARGLADGVGQSLGRAEEERAVEAEQRDALVARHRVAGQRLALHPARRRESTQRDDARRENADADGDDEVEGDRDGRRRGEDEGVRPGGRDDAPHGRHRDHAHGRDHENPRESGERNRRHDRARQIDDTDEHKRVDDRREPRPPTGPHVHGGAGYGSRGGHAAEQSRGDGGEPLPHELTVGVEAARVGERGTHAGREQ